MLVCSNCGEENPDRAKFCLNCGSALEAATPSPGRERKFVTILFADVTGSTGLGERLDPERLKDVMSAYFDAMRAEIEAEGGTVEKFIGDAVMAAFGVPQAHEDDPARALRAALRMRFRLGELNLDLERRFGVTLEARIGVNSGEVLASTAPRPDEGMVTGDAVNVAARLEQAAQPGEVLVAERTAKATRGFLFDQAVTLGLKGKEASVAAMRLLGQEKAPDRGVPGLRAPLVGRDQELTLLSALFERVRGEHRPHLVTVYGDPGVGKSRLTAEFLSSVSDGARVVRGRCLPYGEGVTYWPLAEILKGHAGVLDSDPPDVAMAKIRQAGRTTIGPELAADPARATAALAYTVGLNDAEFGFERLPPRQVRVETHDGWRSFFSALAQEQATVVVIEDIHWADPALLDLLEELAERSQGSLLFVCPARPELTQRRPTWGGGKRNFSSIFLEPLSRDDADRLVGFLLSVEDMPPSLHDAILERAEGNPFFLEEILRQLIDEGRIVRVGERWRAAEEIERVVIPDTVQGVLAARIDLLEGDEKRTLQSAAVVGRVFWTGPVGRLLNGQAEQLDEILGKLQERELVLSRLWSSMAGDREYIFKHILTRDVAYESLPRRDRAAAHAQVARWIEETAGERRREFAELLAYHCSEAHAGSRDDPTATPEEVEALRRRAFEYLMSAAAESRGKAVIGKALRFAEQGQAMSERAVERAEALEALGDIYNTDYQGDLAYRYFREAADLRLRELPDDRKAIALACAKALEVPTRWPGSMTSLPDEKEVAPYLETGLAHAGDGDSEERVALLTAKAFWPFGFPEEAGGDEERRESVEAGHEAADMALRLGRVDLASAALDGLGSAYIIKGLYNRVDEAVQRRLSLAHELHDPWELGDMFAMHAWDLFHLGRYAEADRAATEGLDVVGETGPSFTAHLLAWRSSARARLGEWDQALDDVAIGKALIGDRTPPPFMRHLFGVGAFVYDARGDRAEADRHSEVLWRMADDRRRVRGLLGATFWVATMLVRRGEFGEARELLDTNDASPLGVNIGLALDARCILVATEGAWEEADEVLERTRAHAEEAGLLALPLMADRLEGRAALAAGDADRAVDLLGRARDGLAELGAGWEVACTDLSLAEALLQMGRREETATLLSAALAVFDRLRSVQELERTRELLTKLR